MPDQNISEVPEFQLEPEKLKEAAQVFCTGIDDQLYDRWNENVQAKYDLGGSRFERITRALSQDNLNYLVHSLLNNEAQTTEIVNAELHLKKSMEIYLRHIRDNWSKALMQELETRRQNEEYNQANLKRAAERKALMKEIKLSSRQQDIADKLGWTY